MTARKPVVKVGPIAAPVVRTAAQGGVTWIAMEITEAYNLYDFTDRQWAITLFAGTTFCAWLQNMLEHRRGRKLIGAR